MDVQLSLQLVKEDDGQFTLLAATVTPSQAFRPAEPFIGAPAGEFVLAETLPVTLPLVLFGSPPVPSTAVVYHTLYERARHHFYSMSTLLPLRPRELSPRFSQIRVNLRLSKPGLLCRKPCRDRMSLSARSWRTRSVSVPTA
jgi:hypothetical protein